MKTKLEIIEETAAAYNFRTRSTSASGACQYLGNGKKRCAFSRCCMEDEDTENTLKAFDSYSVSAVSSNTWSALEKLLKPEYAGHSMEFWREIQGFHDCHSNWDEKGLSLFGEQHKKAIIAKYT